MLNKELLQQALDALEALQGGCTDSDDGTVEAITVWCPEVITALRSALAAPMPEPAMYRVTAPIMFGRWIEVDAAQYAEYLSQGWQGQKLYAAPPAAPAPVVPEGDVVVSWNEDGQIVAVTRQDEEGRILSVIAESADPVVREPIIDEMDAVASKYAHKLALDLECVLSDYNGRWWDAAMNTIGEYRMAMNAIHERESPTHMGEPMLPKRGITGGSNEI